MSKSSAPTAQELVTVMVEAARVNPRAVRELLGAMRAMYLTNNPKPPSRSKADRERHARIKAIVRPIDFKRAAKIMQGAAQS